MTHRLPSTAAIICMLVVGSWQNLDALEITVDYRFDTNNFFDSTTVSGQAARMALEAAADRYSNLITTNLAAVRMVDDDFDARIGFPHPSRNDSLRISAAASPETDAILNAGGEVADVYLGELSLAEGEFLLFAGAQSLPFSAIGGTGTGRNFPEVFVDPNSHLNRQFRPSGSVDNLPVWGGFVSFNQNLDWHFELDSPSSSGESDFYTVALHEIGHSFGLNTRWQEWLDQIEGTNFFGKNAVRTFNEENDANELYLELQSQNNTHWKDNEYDSEIFPGGSPNLVGTVGLDSKQDLIMEAAFSYTSEIRRFEITNLEVAALEDIGWSVIEALNCDHDFDTDCDVDDLDSVIAGIVAGDLALTDRDSWLAEAAQRNGQPTPYLVGDANLDGIVDAIDLTAVGMNWTQATGLWSKGDFDGSGVTDPSDLTKLGINWQQSNNAAFAIVPEPSASVMNFFVFGCWLLCLSRRSS